MSDLRLYYNENGELVSYQLDMAKREFYRDALCTSALSDMPLAAPEVPLAVPPPGYVIYYAVESIDPVTGLWSDTGINAEHLPARED